MMARRWALAKSTAAAIYPVYRAVYPALSPVVAVQVSVAGNSQPQLLLLLLIMMMMRARARGCASLQPCDRLVRPTHVS